jgi:hypothetical protein
MKRILLELLANAILAGMLALLWWLFELDRALGHELTYLHFLGLITALDAILCWLRVRATLRDIP